MRAEDTLGFAPLREIEGGAASCREAFERPGAFLHHEVVADGNRPGPALKGGCDVDQAFGFREGEGFEDNRIEHGEKGGGGADAETQGKEGHEGEHAVPTQLPKCEADILEETGK